MAPRVSLSANPIACRHACMQSFQHLNNLGLFCTKSKMTRIKPVKLPKELVAVILDFEGSLIRDWQMDFCKSIYIEAYKRYFGQTLTFKKICQQNSYLALYVQFSKWMQTHNRWNRVRRSQKHMDPWRRLFPAQCASARKKALKHSEYAENVVRLMASKPPSLRMSSLLMFL